MLFIVFFFEGYGFCKKGEGVVFIEDGVFDFGGWLLVNILGGGFFEVYVYGFNLINEGVC